MNYEELVKELRFGAEYGCDYDLIERAAAAIEALEAEVDKWTYNATLEQSKAIANFESYCKLKEQMPKRGWWIESEEKEWGIYPFKKQTCSVCDCKIDHEFMLACMDYFDDRDTVFHYCPNCGARMEVQDA